MSIKKNESDFESQYFEDSHFSKLGGYDFLTRLNLWRPKKYRKLIMKHASSYHETLLDIGCAYGHFLELLKDDFEIHGMDVSNHAIKVARTRVKCNYKQGNLEKEGIPFSNSFDIITAISVIEHLKDPKKAIRVIYGHLNAGGLFCLEIPTISNKISAIIYKLFFSQDITHIYIPSVKEIEKVIITSGFKKIAWYSSLFPIFTKREKFVKDFSFIFGIFQKRGN